MSGRSDMWSMHENNFEDADGYEDNQVSALIKEQQGKDEDSVKGQDMRVNSAAAKMPKLRPTGKGLAAANCGPKGVIEDYKEAQRNQAAQWMMRGLRDERMINKSTNGDRKNENIRLAQQVSAAAVTSQVPPATHSDSESPLSDFSDEEFEKKYLERQREARLNMLVVPEYGDYVKMEDKKEMAATISQAHELSWVVIHVYENHLPTCARLHLVFEDLCTQFPKVLFRRIRSQDCMEGYDAVGLPTLLVYRGAECVQTHMRVHDQMGGLSDSHVVRFLATKGILGEPTAQVRAQIERLNRDEI